MDDLRYPIGKFQFAPPTSERQRADWIAEVAATPARLREAVRALDQEQLDTPYRDGGWTLRQVAHHLPDSHLNAYVRMRLAVTEDSPTIRPYDEKRWAALHDSRAAPVDVSLDLLEALHRRWLRFLETLKPADWGRTFHHPEHGRNFTLDEVLASYAWHGRHHVAHITSLRKRMGWD